MLGMPPYIHGTVPAVLLPIEGWKIGLFDCMDDPINGKCSLNPCWFVDAISSGDDDKDKEWWLNSLEEVIQLWE